MPEDWGRVQIQDRLEPRKTDLLPEPDDLLSVLWCNCKTDGNIKRCTCKTVLLPVESVKVLPVKIHQDFLMTMLTLTMTICNLVRYMKSLECMTDIILLSKAT